MIGRHCLHVRLATTCYSGVMEPAGGCQSARRGTGKVDPVLVTLHQPRDIPRRLWSPSTALRYLIDLRLHLCYRID